MSTHKSKIGIRNHRSLSRSRKTWATWAQYWPGDRKAETRAKATRAWLDYGGEGGLRRLASM